MTKTIERRCVHCCEIVERLNKDHVFPESWYPSDNTSNLEKWTVPSCIPCNTEYGKIERELLVKFSMCANPAVEGMQPLLERALRSVQPSAGKNERDASARRSMGNKLIEETMGFDEIPDGGIIPGLMETERIGDRYLALKIPQRKLFKLVRKFVRGLVYIERSEFIPDDESINVHILSEANVAIIQSEIEPHAKHIERGKGFKVTFAFIEEDVVAGVVIFTVWDNWRFCATVGC